MSEYAVTADGLGKEYSIGLTPYRYKALRDVISGMGRAPANVFRRLRRGKSDDPRRKFWALKDVSFKVQAGEVVGLVGRNGAGKSTLLKVLSRITEPTTGETRIRGRVGSLLEVGSGFHPELTGRENIFLNGAILGMRRSEIQRKFDEIVAFSEVERFVDTPVKRFSSGMYLRLAFAVAAHLETEILFVDEVLAVGDAAFQKKCLGKMSEVSKDGRTVLFVSHNMTAVQTLCSRAIWLEGGQVADDGPAGSVVKKYLQSTAHGSLHKVWDDSVPGHATRLLEARVLSRDVHHITVNDDIVIETQYWNEYDRSCLNVSMTVYTLEGVCVMNSFSRPTVFPRGRIRSTCTIPGKLLNDGQYRIQLMLVKDSATILTNHESALLFEVYDVPRDIDWYGEWRGVVRPMLNWHSEVEEPGATPGRVAISSTAD